MIFPDGAQEAIEERARTIMQMALMEGGLLLTEEELIVASMAMKAGVSATIEYIADGIDRHGTGD